MNTPAPRTSRAPIALLAGLVAVAALAAVSLLRPAWLERAGWPPFAALATAAGTTQVATERRGKPNRLIHEKSPYLLQHAYNPVDWYPWGEEAFAKARAEDKPIFLSIGYSTCHWCHVMERESFENDSVAAVLNNLYVCIKVDREERPDVDRLYMTASQAMGTGGGWPLNVFLTPDLKPFFGGTYFPPDAKMGRPGLLQVLPHVSEVWTTRRDEVVQNAARVIEALGRLAAPDNASSSREQLLAECADTLARVHDPEHGGFGGPPKFPSIVNLNFLMRWYARDPQGHADALAMVRRQLDAMRAGGIHDHLGGGFHRYSVDGVWLVPHFEKMLYDQAQFAWAYLEGYQVTREPAYAATARGVFAYVARDLSSPEGGFYSAEDADSEGEEGRFYVWTPAEIEAVVGQADAVLIAARYGVKERGNFEHGATILNEVRSIETVADEHGATADDVRTRLERAKAKLFAAREQRVRPHRDDKVLVAWNGIMISAFARGARVLEDRELAERAAKSAEFIWTHLRDAKTGALTRRWRDGEAKGAGQLDDYAYYAAGLIDLYYATLEPRWLERATAVTRAQIERFWDAQDGGFFESPEGDATIAVRMKDGFDGAEMAGNSIAAQNLQALAALSGDAAWEDMAQRTLDYYARRLTGQSAAMPQMMAALEWAQSEPRQIVIAGDPAAADTRAMIAEANRRFAPHDQLLLVDGGARQKEVATLAPFVATHAAIGGKATAYVCVDRACKLPTTDVKAFAAQLDAPRESKRVAKGQ